MEHNTAQPKPEQPRQTTEFDELPISQEVKQAIAEMGFITMTQVQREALPPLLAGKEVIAKAPTGTGKTCAFGIPIIESIAPDEQRVRALILAPTRELAVQITQELRALARFKPHIRMVTLYGGQPIDRQLSALKRRPQIKPHSKTGRCMGNSMFPI